MKPTFFIAASIAIMRFSNDNLFPLRIMKRKNRNSVEKRLSRQNRNAFTLIEIMVVLFILVAISAAAVGVYQGRLERSRRDTTLVYVRSLAQFLDAYQLDVGRFPTTEQGLNALIECPSDLPDPSKWAGPYIRENAQTLDPWQNPYQYVSPGTHSRDGYDVWSFGSDRIDGTDDDIGNWTK